MFKILEVFLILFFILCFHPLLVKGSSFIDVNVEDVTYDAVEYLFQKKIIKGYPDPNNPLKLYFKPEQAVNRFEALKMLLQTTNIDIPEASGEEITYFKDLEKGAWYLKYVGKAKTLGIINGNADGTFRPAREVNKVEFLEMLLLANSESLQRYQEFTDFPYEDIKNEWYFPYLNYALSYSLIYPDAQGKIMPGQYLTRAEVAEIIYRYLLLKEGGEIQALLNQSESLIIQTLEYIVDGKYYEADVKASTSLILAEQAFDKTSSQTIVNAAYKIAGANKKISEAFVYYKDKKYEQAINSARIAKEQAATARSIDYNVNPLAETIIERADSVIVLSQAG